MAKKNEEKTVGPATAEDFVVEQLRKNGETLKSIDDSLKTLVELLRPSRAQTVIIPGVTKP